MRSERTLLHLQLPGHSGAMNRMLELVNWHNHISAACVRSFAALGAVLPWTEKMDKAKHLMSAVDYIKELQVRASSSDWDPRTSS